MRLGKQPNFDCSKNLLTLRKSMKEDFRRHPVMLGGYWEDNRETLSGFGEASGSSQKCNSSNALFVVCLVRMLKCTRMSIIYGQLEWEECDCGKSGTSVYSIAISYSVKLQQVSPDEWGHHIIAVCLKPSNSQTHAHTIVFTSFWFNQTPGNSPRLLLKAQV